MKDIHKDFQKAHDNAILFLGRYTSLNKEEVILFLEKFAIRYTDTLDDDVVMVVEGTILSPLEEEMATLAYQKKIPIYNTDQFDKLYATQLNSDSILMSLKLSNNQDRLARLLHNQHLTDALFIKLFAMYDWRGEGMFDSSENMKMSTLFAKRFFSKSRFDAATYHSPISIFEVALLTQNPDLLEVMFSLPKIKVKQSRSGIKRPTTTREAIAINPYTNDKTLTKLLRQDDPEIDYFLALNPASSHQIQEQLFNRGSQQTKEALAQNENLAPELFARLINYPILWECQKIDSQRLQLLQAPYPPKIATNENLCEDVIDTLMNSKDLNILQNLAKNATLSTIQLQKLYDLQNPALYPFLCANPNTPHEILQILFEKDDHQIQIYLARNTKAPLTLLQQLFEKDDFEINCSLAHNEALPISWLQQLQIDSRLLTYLKENKIFTQNILHNLGI